MEVFVLSIYRFEMLDVLEVFDSYEHAYEYAIKFCDIVNMPSVYRIDRRTDQMRGWVIADSTQYFISILERKVSLLAPAKPAATLASYNDISDLVSGKSATITSDSITNPTVVIAPLPTASTVPAALFDNPYDDNLPAGFHYNGSPLVMVDVKREPYCTNSIYSLSQNQKFALVIARINKRPNFKIDLNNHFPSNFSQSEALKALKERTTAGQMIMDKELDLLQAFYDKCEQDQYSSNDESSSEDEDSEI